MCDMKTVMEFCFLCGDEFEKLNHNQRYCCDECRETAEKQRKRQRDRQRRMEAKRSIKSGAKFPSIADMVDMGMKLSKECGRVVQYGEVQKMLLTGRIKVKDGVMV